METYGNAQKTQGKDCVPHYFFKNFDDIVGIDDYFSQSFFIYSMKFSKEDLL